MIPTRIKEKLPRTLSYPIGAQAISEVLAAAPHADEFSIGFFDRPGRGPRPFQQVLKDGLPYDIVTIKFRPRRNVPPFGGHGDDWDTWWFCVFPTTREMRQLAGLLLR